jgi:TorA maturation chaperone TorD
MLADVGGFYSAFGFQVAGDLSDHLGAELEFMAVLCLKEAYAREQGWAGQAETCAHARRRFLAEHIGRWLPVFVMRVKDNARLPFFAALAELTEAVVSHDCAALGAAPDRTGVFMPEPAQTALVEQDDGMCAA